MERDGSRSSQRASYQIHTIVQRDAGLSEDVAFDVET